MPVPNFNVSYETPKFLNIASQVADVAVDVLLDSDYFIDLPTKAIDFIPDFVDVVFKMVAVALLAMVVSPSVEVVPFRSSVVIVIVVVMLVLIVTEARASR